ncbi:MAG TPA: response regulator, partial [Pseudobdellovibrionaceae bacterium]|nr:response regulator [Pseudobdellovibrionaceae bacterium]
FESYADHPQLLRNARRVLAGETFTDEVKLQGRVYDTWYSPVRNAEGEILSLVAVAADITEKVRVRAELVEAKEIAEKANVAKSRFLANMSHEIRTPVTALTGFAQLLKRDSITPEEKGSYLAIIERNGEQLMRLIDDILDLSKVESGKMTFEKSTLTLKSLLSDLQSFVDVKRRDLDIRFSVSFRGRVPEKFQTDSVRLKQILTNIVGNAMKFTRKGRVDLTVFVCDGFLCFEIKDDGPGIEEETAKTLFCPFVQADTSITRKFGGTGLGLALSRALARSMGGEIELLESVPGRGCRFEVRIDPGPLDGIASYQDVADMNEEKTPAAGKNPYVGKLIGRRILLVEDMPDNRTLIKAYLKDTGADVQTAQDGVEGVEMVRREHFDLALMDIQMPRRDGYEATRILREEGYHIPIVALTAHAMSEEQDRCLKAGCTVHLSKPVDRFQLIETIVNLTGDRTLH